MCGKAGLSERASLFPRLERHFLQRVLTGVVIPEYRVGHTVQHTAMDFDLPDEEILVHQLISL